MTLRSAALVAVPLALAGLIAVTVPHDGDTANLRNTSGEGGDQCSYSGSGSSHSTTC